MCYAGISEQRYGCNEVFMWAGLPHPTTPVKDGNGAKRTEKANKAENASEHASKMSEQRVSGVQFMAKATPSAPRGRETESRDLESCTGATQ